jgi:ATP-dependent helicase/nuclease subunit A
VARAARARRAEPALERARSLLGRWHALVAALPPHDLLDRVIVESDAHARYAAAVPPEQRAFALDAIDAVLAQSLYLDGGRYATPYAFVRRLKKRAVKAALPVRASTVRLLTVHGAKGLEADTVFVMDTEPEPVKPADDDAARRVAGRGRAADAMRLRLQREPLPAVAARSARRRAARARARGAERPLRRDVAGEAAPLLQRHRALPRAERSDVVEPRRRGVPGLAAAASRAALSICPPRRRSDGATRGHRHRDAAAVARVLDRRRRPARRGAGGERADRPGRPPCARMDRGDAAIDRHEAADAAARSSAPRPEAVRASSAAIVDHPEGARFFRGAQIRWRGNEVSLSDAGDVLRIDRLVLSTRATGRSGGCSTTSSAIAPDELDAYRDQLLRYRAAVARAQPARPSVRLRAFVTGRGRGLIEAVGACNGAALHGKKPHFPALDRAIGEGSGTLQSANSVVRDAVRCRSADPLFVAAARLRHFVLGRLLAKSELTMVWLATDTRTGGEAMLSMPRLRRPARRASATGC